MEKQTRLGLAGKGEKAEIWEGKTKRKSQTDNEDEQEVNKRKQLLATMWGNAVM